MTVSFIFERTKKYVHVSETPIEGSCVWDSHKKLEDMKLKDNSFHVILRILCLEINFGKYIFQWETKLAEMKVTVSMLTTSVN